MQGQAWLMGLGLGWGLALMPLVAQADAPSEPGLRATLHQLDHQLFDAFNRCASPAELDKHAAFFDPAVEFYHDSGGVTWSRETMLANTQRHACGRYTRQLVEASFGVSPVKDFGAITTGVHRFCQAGTQECAGEAQFLMVWRLQDGHWRVTRVMSFGHRPAQ